MLSSSDAALISLGLAVATGTGLALLRARAVVELAELVWPARRERALVALGITGVALLLFLISAGIAFGPKLPFAAAPLMCLSIYLWLTRGAVALYALQGESPDGSKRAPPHEPEQ